MLVNWVLSHLSHRGSWVFILEVIQVRNHMLVTTVVRYQKNFLRIKGPIKTQISAPIVVGSWCTSSTTLGMMLALHHPKVIPIGPSVGNHVRGEGVLGEEIHHQQEDVPWSMGHCFAHGRPDGWCCSSGVSRPRWRCFWRGDTSSTRRCSMINGALLRTRTARWLVLYPLQLRCITEDKLTLQRFLYIATFPFPAGHSTVVSRTWWLPKYLM